MEESIRVLIADDHPLFRTAYEGCGLATRYGGCGGGKQRRASCRAG
jgi:hypothetical protein